MTGTTKSFIAPNRWALAFVLALLFGLGLSIRLTDLTDLPLDFHPTRQLFSAIKARGIFYESTPPNIPDWQRDMALLAYKADATLEPPVLDHLVAASYRIFGEHLWIARIYSLTFWMIGGIFLYLIARELLPLDEALLSLTVYLFLPYGVFASRSFQPDPLMVMLLLIGLWSAVRWSKGPSWMWVILAGLAGGIAIFIKLPAMFFVAGGFIGAVLAHRSLKDALRMPQVWVMAVLTVLPGAAYTIYGVYIARYLGSEFAGRFFPQLWIDPFFYLRWEGKVALVLTHIGLACALLGLFFLRTRENRIFMISLWVGYVVFGMIFNYHIASHDYYNLPLIPIASLSLGALGGVLIRGLAEQAGRSGWSRWFIRLALLFIVVMTYWDAHLKLRTTDYRPQAEYWASVGEAVGHMPSVIALTQDYGYPLVYWGWQRAMLWPETQSSILGGNQSDFENRFKSLTKGKIYFLVTDYDELKLQPELDEYLHSHYPVHAEGDGFMIYTLTQPLDN